MVKWKPARWHRVATLQGLFGTRLPLLLGETALEARVLFNTTTLDAHNRGNMFMHSVCDSDVGNRRDIELGGVLMAS